MPTVRTAEDAFKKAEQDTPSVSGHSINGEHFRSPPHNKDVPTTSVRLLSDRREHAARLRRPIQAARVGEASGLNESSGSDKKQDTEKPQKIILYYDAGL
ncbi:hypothetical protein BKA70DRAFT_1432168 [Coprinopsis sp. MPI-PUGE-AT-0042]|nr:hypothetical protein BKA70DRAFT_1432168 [Coprinopsis sp. MPI-PUGE-AT-0042]